MVVQRWAAFSTDPAGGNPVGVGYSETAFVTGSGRQRGIPATEGITVAGTAVPIV